METEWFVKPRLTLFSTDFYMHHNSYEKLEETSLRPVNLFGIVPLAEIGQRAMEGRECVDIK